MSAPTSIPSTPHNQKRDSTSGPVPNLISTLRSDNRDQLLSLLSIDPHSNSNDINVPADSATSNTPISHRQRLVFATDSLRTLLLYHTLFDRQGTNSSNKKKKKSSNAANSILTHDEIALGLDGYNPYGIVNTRILYPNNNSCTENTQMNMHMSATSAMHSSHTGGGSASTSTATATATSLQGTETIYNPSASSTAAGKNVSSLFNVHHDLIDSNDVSVVVYFILPLPEHVKTVCKIIQSYTNATSLNANTSKTTNSPSRNSNSNNRNNPFDQQQSTKLKHRIVFLQRCTKLCTQILYDENILPSPESNTDNLKGGVGGGGGTSNSGNNSNVLINASKNIVVHTLDINLIPIEDDILTLLDTSSIMKDISSIHGVPSLHVNCIASSIMKIQTICNGGDSGEGLGGNGENNDPNSGTGSGDCGGFIPRIQSFGKISESILKRCFDLRKEEYYESCTTSNSSNNDNGNSNSSNDDSTGDIQAMMILDRRVDLITPMLTPLTYEGLLDDVLSIESGMLHVKTDIINPPDDDIDAQSKEDKSNSSKITSLSKQKKNENNKPVYTLLPLNDQDTLYVEVRDQHVERFGSFLQEQAKALKESHANFSNKDKDLTEIHMFVKQIPIFTQNLKSLTHHIHLAELIKHTTIQSEFRQRWQIERSIVESESCFDVIEDLIASQYNVWRVLRLLCLHSLTNGGIKTNKLDTLKREVVQTYGYEFAFLLQNLESIGLLRKKDTLWDTASSSSYGMLRKQLQLIQPDVDPLDPDDVSYVSSGFAPISARIIQTAMKGWVGKEDALKEIPGRGKDVIQKYPPEEYNAALKRSIGAPLGVWAKQLKIKQNANDRDNSSGGKKKKPVLLVYFVGGITYAEIAAMRFMSKRSSFPFSIVCCTTKIINGTSFLQSLA